MNRLQLAKYLLDVSQQAVKMKERLLKDQLRTATAREVHLKQWGAVERDLTDAMAELIHRQFASASKTISEEGKTKFDPRDWDDDLIDSALPILMKHAGQAAAAQMLMMGVDVAPKKRRKTEKGDLPGHPFRGNQWTGGQGSSGSVMDHLSEENRKAFFDVAGYEQDDFDKLVEAIETGDSKTFNLYREDDGVVDAIEIAVWRSKGVKPFDGDGIDPKKLTGDDAGPGFGPFQRAGIMGDVADEGMTWVSPTRVYAENYQTGSREVRPYAANVKKPLDLRKLSGTDDLDPEDVSSLLADHGIDIPASRMRAGEIHQVIESVAVELREKAIKAGFDSIVQNENYDGQPQQTLVVFHGRDLKLLTNPKEKSPSFFRTKASRATDWLLSLQDEDEDLSALWPEVFSLPGGGAVDLAFATEWPAWMKAEISKQMKETFEQPFWAGINDTTAKGIEAHVLKGLEDGLSIREIRESMVGDGLNEYYRNRGINIARTESGSALNGARSAAMDRLQEEVPGLKVKRTWMSVLGTTTRDSHAHLDGVPADRDGEWYLGGVKVPWPGHWRLPPSERCQCQCTIVQSWGMDDTAAEELIADYNERLAEERRIRDLWMKGDLPGHPFRGNQWGPGRGRAEFSGSADYEADIALQVLEGRQPPNAATSVRRIDSSSIKSDEPLKEGGVNEARVVEIEGEGKFCFKPDEGEHPQVHPAYRGHQSANEVAASVVDEAMGLGMVAKTEMVEIDGRKGSLQRWVNDDAAVAKSLIKFDEHDEIKDTSALDKAEGVSDMMHYDALIGNTDRHFGNWLVKDGKVQLIDNGMSMADNMEYGDSALRYRSMEHQSGAKRGFQKMTPKFKEGLGRLLKNKAEVDAKLAASGVGPAQRASFWKRAEYMQKAGMLGFGDGLMRDLGRLSEGMPLF